MPKVPLSLAGIALAFSLLGAPTASAGVHDADHDAEVREEGSSETGDAIGGQVVGSTSDGDTEIDAANRSHDARVRSGDGAASNDIESVVWTTGLGDELDDDDEIALIDDDDDDVEDDWDFESFATTGDGIGGQVLGVATASGGSADVVVANDSDDVDLESGDAEALDSALAETGTVIGGQAAGVSSAGLTSLDATNRTHDVAVESGEAFARFDDAVALTGDGIAGELVGIVTGPVGRADVVLANTSEDLDVRTGDADALFEAFAETGDGIAGQLAGINAGGETSVDGTNASRNSEIRTGDAEAIFETESVTGDGVSGQVLGVVTSPGGSADLVSANTSDFVDLFTGEAFSQN